MSYFNLYSVKFNDLKLEPGTQNYSSQINYEGQLSIPGMKIVDVKSDEPRVLEVEFLTQHPDFYDLIYSIDNYTIDGIINSGESWFGSKPNYETIDHLCQRTIKAPKSIHNNPTMEVFVSKDCEVYDKEGKSLSVDDLNINNEISLDLVLRNVTFKKTKCQLVYDAVRINITNYLGTVTESIMDSTEEYSDITEALYAMTSSESLDD